MKKYQLLCNGEFIKKNKKYNSQDMLLEYDNTIKNIKIKNNQFKCDICAKIYTSYNGLKKHTLKNNYTTTQLDICDRLRKKYNISNKIDASNTTNAAITTTNSNSNILNSNISHSSVNSNKNTQNNITNNINNNIKLVPYDEIKYDYMKESVLRQAFEIPGEAFKSITADTFFDPENKENHVIYCPNLKDGQIHVFNGNKFSADDWEVCLR